MHLFHPQHKKKNIPLHCCSDIFSNRLSAGHYSTPKVNLCLAATSFLYLFMRPPGVHIKALFKGHRKCLSIVKKRKGTRGTFYDLDILMLLSLVLMCILCYTLLEIMWKVHKAIWKWDVTNVLTFEIFVCVFLHVE